jgi:hypothetical protein
MIRGVLCGLAVMIGTGSICFGQAQKPGAAKRAADLKKEIAATKAKLVKLEAELAKLEPPAAPEPAPAAKLNHVDLEVGMIGMFGSGNEAWNVWVDKVIDENSAIIRAMGGANSRPLRVIAEKFPTAGYADGKFLTKDRLLTWKVTGTKMYQGQTYFVVEPVSPENNPPKP